MVHPGELLTLLQLGITSISQVINGNAVNLPGTYTLANGAQRTIGDAWFPTARRAPDTQTSSCSSSYGMRA